MWTIYPHESGLAWSSYLLDLGKYHLAPRLHIIAEERSPVTLCGIPVGRNWVWGEDAEFQPTQEAADNFLNNSGLGCKRCARELQKRVRRTQTLSEDKGDKPGP